MTVAVERQKRDNDPAADFESRPIKTRHVQILLDRSGSMASISGAMEQGFATFLAEQQAIPGADAIKFVLTQFDTQGVEDVITGTLASAKPFSLIPRGGTPLYASVIETITRAEKRMGEDDAMLFVIITDGGETDGGDLKAARDLIAKKMDEGWVFSYLGANQDAWSVSAGLGMNAATTRNYAATAGGTAYASQSYSGITTDYRSSNTRADLKNLTIDQTDETPVTKAKDVP